MKKLFLIALFLCVTNAHAQPQGPMAGNILPGVERGKILGVLVEKEKGAQKPMGGQSIALMVFQNGQRILVLDKNTDEKGNFVFGNIFKDSSYTYALGYMREQELYVMPDLQIKPGGVDLNVQFIIGAGSPYRIAQEEMNQAMNASQGENGGVDLGMSSSAGGAASFSAMGKWADSYQTLALVLSGLVLLLSFYFAARRN